VCHTILDQHSRDALTSLFTSVFTASEGHREGRLIGKLAAALSSGIDNQDIICFGTYEDASIIGSIFFTRLSFSEDIPVYLLAPVAVSTAHQGRGVGQALIRHGLDEMKKRAVSVVTTYGDPAFYAKLGFQPLSEKQLPAPLTLSMPQGWLGQSLTDQPIPTFVDRPTCVQALDDPVYW
jgi:predicted N-acetyltransferase YhbS